MKHGFKVFRAYTTEDLESIMNTWVKTVSRPNFRIRRTQFAVAVVPPSEVLPGSFAYTGATTHVVFSALVNYEDLDGDL